MLIPQIFFSHRPILYHKSLQRTDFAPLSSSFCAPFTNFTRKIAFFPSSLRNIYPKFRFFAPSFWAAPGAVPSTAP